MRDDSLQELLAAIDIEAWLEREGVDFKVGRGSSGVQLNVRECPCCGNTKWKVYLNQETGLGNCFVCQATFNKWKFIKASLGDQPVPKIVAHVEQVAREQGWKAPRRHTAAVELKPLTLPESLEIPIHGRNLTYLERRGITADVARYFNLRYCQRGSFAGQAFDGRVILPVFDLEGNLVSFQGRALSGTAERKYLFPAGYAATGAHLYNGQNAQGTERVVVGEGAFDVMALKIAMDGEAALRDVVPIGTFGKHLSKGEGDTQEAKFMALQKRGVKQVTFMWDAEPQALADAIDAALYLKGLGFVTRVAVLPPGRDPNECSAETVRRAFWEAAVATPAAGAALRLKLASGH